MGIDVFVQQDPFGNLPFCKMGDKWAISVYIHKIIHLISLLVFISFHH